jgi:hypothetical protein
MTRDKRLLNGWYHSEIEALIAAHPEALTTNDWTKWWMYSIQAVGWARWKAMIRINIIKPLQRIIDRMIVEKK